MVIIIIIIIIIIIMKIIIIVIMIMIIIRIIRKRIKYVTFIGRFPFMKEISKHFTIQL